MMNQRVFRIMCLALGVCLLLSGCAARTETVYTASEVTGSAQLDPMFDRFYQSGETGPLIPGLKEGLVPQGIGWLKEEDWLLISGYRADKGPSALIAIDRQTGDVRRTVHLRKTDGSAYTGHAGGVCVTETDIFVSNNHLLYRLPLADFRAAGENAALSFAEEIPVPVNSSFCAYDEGMLWVGEFQYAGDYPTDPSHRAKTADGLQRAWVCGYRLTEGQDFSCPDAVLSIPERIQGITVTGGRICLSQSYGQKNLSSLYFYRDVTREPAEQTVSVNGREVPFYILDSSVREKVLLCPPMTECLCTAEGKIYVLFESAAQPYRTQSSPSRNPMDRVFVLTGTGE